MGHVLFLNGLLVGALAATVITAAFLNASISTSASARKL
jgi:hypothetical protein